MRLNIKHSTFVFILVAAAIAVYANTLPNEMFWDDDDFILRNTFIQDWRFWPRFFTDNILAGAHLVSNYWRPLLQIVFAVEWHLWADWAPGWHMVNILFHTLDALLLFRLFNTLARTVNGTTRTTQTAFGAALFFLIHPAQTETVAYVNSLGDALSFFFVLLALNAYAVFRGQGSLPIARTPQAGYGVAFFCFPLALMSKEMGLILLLLLPLCDGILLKRTVLGWRRWRSLLMAWLPFLILAAGYALLRSTVLHFSGNEHYYPDRPDFHNNILVRICTFLTTLPDYFKLIFWPAVLQYDRPFPIAPLALTPKVVLGAGILGSLLALIGINRIHRPLLALGGTWFLLTLLPYSNIGLIINGIFYEHFLYVPLAGLGLMLSSLFMEIHTTLKSRGHSSCPVFHKLVILVPILLFLGLGLRSFIRNQDWRTAIGFYEKTALHAQNSYRVFNNLGMEYAEKGRLIEAERTYKKAISLDPTNAVAWHNLGNLYQNTRHFPEARAHFEKALALQPTFIFSYKYLAQLYLDTYDFMNARRVLEGYLKYTAEKEYTLGVLITIAQKQNDTRALAVYQNALQRLRQPKAIRTEPLQPQKNAATWPKVQ